MVNNLPLVRELAWWVEKWKRHRDTLYMMLIDTILTMPEATIEAEYWRWITAINAVIAFCDMEEGMLLQLGLSRSQCRSTHSCGEARVSTRGQGHDRSPPGDRVHLYRYTRPKTNDLLSLCWRLQTPDERADKNSHNVRVFEQTSSLASGQDG
jgi:hypothetical protein